MTNRPFLSFVVPTRDRPAIVEQCLRSLAAQTYRDIEVVVVDNATDQPCREVFDRVAGDDPRFRYQRPPAPLPMHENWEYAIGLAHGRFVSVIIDKTVVLPQAAAKLFAMHEKHGADIYTWWAESFVPDDPAFGSPGGSYSPQHLLLREEPVRYCPREEIARRFRFESSIIDEGNLYFRGKLCFGAYSSELIRRVKDSMGSLCTLINADFTSAVRALHLAGRCVDMGEPLILQYMSTVSNGYKFPRDPEHAKAFLRTCGFDDAKLAQLPVPNVIAMNNTVGYDYVQLAKQFPPGTYPQVDLANVRRWVRDEIERAPLSDEWKRRILGEIERSDSAESADSSGHGRAGGAAAGAAGDESRYGYGTQSIRKKTPSLVSDRSKTALRNALEKIFPRQYQRRLAWEAAEAARAFECQKQAQAMLEEKSFPNPVAAAAYAYACYQHSFELEARPCPLFPTARRLARAQYPTGDGQAHREGEP